MILSELTFKEKLNSKMFHVVIGSCKILFGPMFSKKSTRLREEITTLADVGLKCLYINNSKDERKTEAQDQNITTHHSGFKGLSDKVKIIKVKNLSSVDVSDYDAIAIDEGQFFEDLEKVVRDWVLKKAKIVIIASLDGDSMMEPFGQAHRLVCICESGNIEKLSALCVKCLEHSLNNGRLIRIPASFTAKFNIDLENYTQIDVGGDEKYLPVCMGCYQKHMSSVNEPIVSSINLDVLNIGIPVTQCI